jgi:hypothetical protein
LFFLGRFNSLRAACAFSLTDSAAAPSWVRRTFLAGLDPPPGGFSGLSGGLEECLAAEEDDDVGGKLGLRVLVDVEEDFSESSFSVSGVGGTAGVSSSSTCNQDNPLFKLNRRE